MDARRGGFLKGGVRCAVMVQHLHCTTLSADTPARHSLACLGVNKFELVGVLVEFLEG